MKSVKKKLFYEMKAEYPPRKWRIASKTVNQKINAEIGDPISNRVLIQAWINIWDEAIKKTV